MHLDVDGENGHISSINKKGRPPYRRPPLAEMIEIVVVSLSAFVSSIRETITIFV